MDAETLHTYDARAGQWAAQYRSVNPAELYLTIQSSFHPDGLTADVGCGSGRDADWLTRRGFPAEGLDASAGMLQEARSAYPAVPFRQTALPDLAGVPDGRYDNVLCSATLMHVRREDLIGAALNLARILRPGGRLVLSYRGAVGDNEREPDGRLFTVIPSGRLALLLESSGFQILQTEVQKDTTRSGVQWVVFVAEKSPLQVSRGLERVQQVLAQDQKAATYKLALLRAMCEVSRNEWSLVRWAGGKVYVPMSSLARRWLIYYWPFMAGEFIKQSWNEAPTGRQNLGFRDALAALGAEFSRKGLYALLRDLDDWPDRYLPVMKRIKEAIRMPVKHAGTYRDPLFQYAARAPGGPAGVEGQLGWVEVPESIWLDISRFDHWIEDSLILRWAKLTAAMNGKDEPGEYLSLLLERPKDERDTSEVRSVLAHVGRPLECVWSGARLGSEYQVDHVIPYSVWGNNDLWNLLPAQTRWNQDKSDSIPTRALLLRRRDCIIDYWHLYHQYMPDRFDRQVRRALGFGTSSSGWERHAFAGLEETVERLAMTRGLTRWQPPV